MITILTSPRWLGLALLLPLVPAAMAQTNAVSDPLLATNAVSEFNAKLDYSGGDMNSAVGHLFDASFSLPLTPQFGFQADGLYSRVDNLNFASGAGHLFWRDPNIGLLGLTGGYLCRDGLDSYQAGLEGECYLGRFTLGFFGGVGSIDYGAVQFRTVNSIVPSPVDTNPTRFIGRISADYYLLNNLRLGASYTTAFEDSLGQGEIEYQTPINGLALTAEVAYGEYDYHHWLFGVRYYFGGHKSLRDRQRQDDPPVLTRQILYDLDLYGAEYDSKVNSFLHPQPVNFPPVNSGAGDSGGDTVITVVPPRIL